MNLPAQRGCKFCVDKCLRTEKSGFTPWKLSCHPDVQKHQQKHTNHKRHEKHLLYSICKKHNGKNTDKAQHPMHIFPHIFFPASMHKNHYQCRKPVGNGIIISGSVDYRASHFPTSFMYSFSASRKGFRLLLLTWIVSPFTMISLP